MTLQEALEKVMEFPEVENLAQAEDLRVLQWSIIEELLDINKHNGSLVRKLEHQYLKLSSLAMDRAFGGRDQEDLPN